MFTQYAPLNKRLKRAVKSRGWAWIDCEISEPCPGVHRVTNVKTTAWLDFDTTGWRVRVFNSSEIQGDAAIAAAEAEAGR